MNDPDRPDGSELQLEALLLYHTIQLQSLEDVLEKVCFAANAKFGGKTFRDYLCAVRAKNIRNILRHRADIEPTKASQLLEILEKMNLGEAP